MKDVNDAKRSGVDLAALLAEADQDDPVLGTKWQTLAKEGLERLATLERTVRAAQGKDDAAAAIVAFQKDEVSRWASAVAMHYQGQEATAHLQGMLLGPKGLTQFVKDLRKAVEKLAEVVALRAEEREGREAGLILDRLTAPLGVKGLRIPAGWQMDDNGLVNSEGSAVTRFPFLMLGTVHDVASSRYRVEVAWKRGGQWTRRQIDRADLQTSRNITALADFGAPVNSRNCAELVAFFEAYEAYNASTMLARRAASHMGWIDDETFMYGPRCQGVSCERLEVPETDKYFAGMHAKGSFDGWKEVIKRHVVGRPMVMAAIYAACASLLLHPLRRPGFIVDWSGLTSRGKTTTLRVGASTVGLPDDFGDGLIRSWKARSVVPFMYAAHVLQSFPLILDDTKRQPNPGIMAQMCYDHPAGQDSDRGQLDGTTRMLRRWRSVMLSTGEAPLTSYSKDGGARARVICLKGAPFGEECGENSIAVNEVRVGLLDNYGHVGPLFVDYLLKNKAKWPALREQHSKHLRALTRDRMSAVVTRLCENVAVMAVAADILHDRLGVPGEWGPTRDLLMQEIAGADSEVNMPLQALRASYAWAWANEKKFWGRDNREVEPSHGWLGRWDQDRDEAPWQFLAFDEKALFHFLEGEGYDTVGTVSAWRHRGWLIAEGKGYRCSGYLKGGVPGVVVRRDALEQQ